MDTITIRYEIHADGQSGTGEFEAPDWLSAEPRLATALYLFGYSEAKVFVTNAEVVSEPLPTNQYNGEDFTEHLCDDECGDVTHPRDGRVVTVRA